MSTHPLHDHPADEQLVIWLDEPESLLPAYASMLEEHIATCERCSARLEEFASVDKGLESLQAIVPTPPAQFQTAVMSALPANLYPLPSHSPWAALRQQLAGAGLMLAGLLSVFLSGDAFLVASQWWQNAHDWLGSANVTDPASLNTWLSNSPGGGLESQLGLLPGAVLLGFGALLFLVSTLRAYPLQQAGGTPNGKDNSPSKMDYGNHNR